MFKQLIFQNVIYLLIVYELDTWSPDLNTDFILKDCLLAPMKLTKNTVPDQYKYSGYSIGFDSRSFSSTPDNTMVRNIINLGADMSSSVHTDKKGKDVLIIGEGPKQGLDYTTFTAEAKCYITFTQSNRKLSKLAL